MLLSGSEVIGSIHGLGGLAAEDFELNDVSQESVTELLAFWSQGDGTALEKLLPLSTANCARLLTGT